jgi:hypothetical protein
LSIRNKFAVLIVSTLLIGAFFTLLHFWNSRETTRATQQLQLFNEVVNHAFRLTVLTQQVIMHPDETRAREQWHKNNRELAEILRQVTPDSPEGRTRLAGMIKSR